MQKIVFMIFITLMVDNLEYESCQPLETQIAHYWFNGDTGRQIDWVANKPYTNWNKELE